MINAYLQWRGDSFYSSQHLIVKFEFPRTAVAEQTATEQEFEFDARRFCDDAAAQEIAGMSYYAAYDERRSLIPAIDARSAEIYATLRRMNYTLTDADCESIRENVIAHHAFKLNDNAPQIEERLERELEEWRNHVWTWVEL